MCNICFVCTEAWFVSKLARPPNFSDFFIRDVTLSYYILRYIRRPLRQYSGTRLWTLNQLQPGRACRSLDPLMPSICGVFFYPQSFTCLDTAHAHSSAVTGRRLAATEVFSLMSHFCQNTMTFSERCASDGQRKVKFWHGCNCDLWTEYTHVAMKEWTFKDWKN